MKILFVKLGAIGDIVHALPALVAAREALPNATISWVAETRSAEVLRGNKLIDDLIEVDTRALRNRRVPGGIFAELRRQARSLRKDRFDIALDLQGLIKSATLAKLSGAKRRIGFDRLSLREPASRVLLTESVKIGPKTHIIDKNIQLVCSGLDIAMPAEPYRFPIYTDASHKSEAEAIAAEIEGDFALLNPAGGWVTKLWPAENYGNLADRLWEECGLRSIVVTGPKEKDLADRAVSTSRSGKLTVADTSIKGFYELSKLASLYIGGDTGPTHLAVAARTPVVGIFGPTEWWRNGSPFPQDICVERNDISCRIDCHRRTCGNWICMDISVDTVLAAVKERLKSIIKPTLLEALV